MHRSILWFCTLVMLNCSNAHAQGRFLLTGPWNADSLRRDLASRHAWTPLPAYADRSSWEKIPAVYRAALVGRGEQLLNYAWRTVPATAYLEYVRSGDIFAMQSISDENFNNLKSLVLAELAEGRGRFLDQIINGSWALCERTSWALSPHLYMQKAGVGLPDVEDPVVDLYAGNTASLLAWTWYFFHEAFDRVNPLISRRIHYEIDRRVLQPFYRRDDFWWLGLKSGSFVNNWTIWINSNILNCILLLEDDPAQRIEGVYKTMSSVDRFLNSYPSDGTCEEGPMYWFRAGGNVYRYLTLLSGATHSRIDLFSNELIRNIGRYIQRVHISEDYYVNFADATARIDQDPGLIFRYGTAIKDGEMQQFGSYLARSRRWDLRLENAESLELSIENLLQVKEMLAFSTGRLPLPAADWFTDSRIAIARDKAGSEKGFYFAARAGNNGTGHGHNDVGSCILFYDGRPLLIDVGRAAYTRETFGPGRYQLWYNRSDYHNLPRINGVDQHAGGKFAARYSVFNDSAVTAAAAIARGDSVPADSRGPAIFSADIAGAYPDSARCQRWIRSYRLDRGHSSFIISDDYRLSGYRDTTCLYFMTADRPEPAGAGRLVWHLHAMSSDSVLEMTYDKTWAPAIESITLTDTIMLHSWPAVIYRIVFRPAGTGVRMLSGKIQWQIRVVPAAGIGFSGCRRRIRMIGSRRQNPLSYRVSGRSDAPAG